MPANQKATDEEFIAAFKEHGSPLKVAKELGMSERRAYERRRALEDKGISLPTFAGPPNAPMSRTMIPDNRRIIQHHIQDGTILVGSDAHYWPDEISVAHQAFVEIAKQLKPNAIVLNGDVLDGARISRHDPLYGTNPPTVKQEIEACQERLGEIEKASKNSTLLWTYGNHDVRLWRYIQINAPELHGMPSMDLFEHFPGWHHGWRVDVNNSTVIKHRWNNGVHAAYNNALKSMLKLNGGSAAIVTGHLHRLMVSNWRGYAGTAYGVDTGTLADPISDQFAYAEGNPSSSCQGFAVLTFRGGMLLPPELCEVIDGVAYFRGKPV